MANKKNIKSNDSNSSIYEEYTFKLSNFDGPLDLLLTLIKKKNISIFEVDLVELCTQYLDIIEKTAQKDLDISSEYLVMASELIYLKSRLILNDEEEAEEVEIDKNKILRLLAEYEEFKKISLSLKEQEALRREIFIKKTEDLSGYIKEVDESLLEGNGNPIKMIIALRKMFERTFAEKLRTIKLEKFNLSPEDRRIEVRQLIDNNPDNITFELLFSVPSLNHFVITLIVILDMVRKEELILEQHKQFDKIYIYKGGMY
ncbi:MAG: segregation/condensation protein A [Metamycoplasmataceae bacterium]